MVEVPRKIRIKTQNKIEKKSFIENDSKILREQKIKKRRDRVPLTDPSTTSEPRSTMTIKDEGKRSRRKTRIDPINPSIRKVHSLEGSKDGHPLN